MNKMKSGAMALALGMTMSILAAPFAMADSAAPEAAPKSVVEAGKDRPHDGPGRGHFRSPFADLDLTPEQRAKMREIRENYSKKMQDETMALLTAEQKAKFQEHMKAMPMMKRGGPDQAPPAPPAN